MKGGEYFKVIDLVDHYITHQSGTYGYSDFLAFLNDHYLNKSHHEKEHKDLPFKSQSLQTVVVACFFETSLSPVIKEQLEFSIITPVSFSEEFISLFSGSIWNPPQ